MELSEEKLNQKVHRYLALNKHHGEFIQKNGHCSSTMIKELKELAEIVRVPLNCGEMSFAKCEIRMTINYFITNNEEEIYNLSVAVKEDGKYVSIWTYYYSMKDGIVSRVKEMDDGFGSKYDIFSYSFAIKTIEECLLASHPGKTMYWDVEMMTFN